MGKPRVVDQQGNFTAGLNSTSDPFLVGETQVRACTNGRLSPYGAITKRGGLQQIHTPAFAASVLRGFSWAPTGTTTPTELIVCNGKLYTTTYAVPATWTDRGSVTVSVNTPGFAAFRDGSSEVAFIATGDDLYSYTAGGVLTGLTAGNPSIPAGVTALCVYNQRLFAIKEDASTATLYWSPLNNGSNLASTATGGGSAVIRTYGDRGLTGLAALGTSLLIFHASGISRFTGVSQDDIAIAAGAQGITGDVGTQSHASIVVVDNLCYFMSERGAYLATEGGVQPLDRPDRPDPTIPIITAMSIANQRKVLAVHQRATQEVWWFLPGTGFYVFNYRLGAWSGPFTGGYTSTTACWDTVDSDGKPIVLTGDSLGFVNRADSSTYYADGVSSAGSGGTPVTLTVQGRRLFAQSPEVSKAFRFAHLYADLGGATSGCTFALDATTGDETLTFPSSAATPYTFRLGCQGPFVDWTFAHSAATSASLSRVSLEAFVLGRRVA